MAIPPKHHNPDGRWPEKHQALARERGYESWEAWVAELEQEKGEEICGGIAKSDSERYGPGPRPCTQPPYKNGNGRCKRFHKGQATDWGPFSHRYRGKGFSRYLPDKLLDIYENMDPAELMSMLEHIRIANAVTGQLLERMSEWEAGAAWQALGQIVGTMRAAVRNKDSDALTAGLGRLSELAEEGAGYWQALEEVRKQQDHVRRLFDSQTTRDKVEAEYMHRREVIALFAQVASDIREVVQDREQRNEISGRMKDRLGPGIFTSSPLPFRN